VSFVEPRFLGEEQGLSGDDHPFADVRNGEAFLNSVYAAVTSSPAWGHTILVINFWDILVTAVDPLANDTPAALLMFYGPMFTAWGLTGFAATWRSGRAVQGAKIDLSSITVAITGTRGHRWKL